MGIDTKHRLYSAFETQWEKCRTLAAGEDAVKATDSYDNGQLFLPALEGQDRNEYNAYKNRATFYNATGRTIEILKGLIFRKDAQKDTANAQIDKFLESVTASGESIDTFARQLVDEMLTTTRGAVLVDHPQVALVDENGNAIIRTVAQVEAMNQRPYFSFYNSESIINWKTAIKNNEDIVEWVILKEIREVVDPDDEYKYNPVEVYRKLYLNESGQYIQEVHGKDDKGDFIIIEGPIMPLMGGKSLDYIPFYYFNGTNMNVAEINKPVLLDLVNVNISHYKSSADLEHALHYTALPTAVITGLNKDGNEQFYIGSAAAWLLKKDCTAFFLEFQGHGIEPLREVLGDKEQQMSKLGARLLAGEKKAVEAAQTAEINRSGESATLADKANLISVVLTRAIETAMEWQGVKGVISYLLNTDFMPLTVPPETLNAWMQSWQSGGMSFDTLYYNMQRGELTRPGVSAEDEKEIIDAEMPEIETTDSGE